MFKEDDMKLCITSTGSDIDASIDTRFGRAPCFLIIDTETKETEVLNNSAASQVQGAGIAAVQLLSDKGVEAVLTGYVGPNATKALQASGIKLFTDTSSQDTVQEALDKFSKGELNESPNTVESYPSGAGRGRGGGRGMGRGRGRCRTS